jgi:hypothetical protein
LKCVESRVSSFRPSPLGNAKKGRGKKQQVNKALQTTNSECMRTNRSECRGESRSGTRRQEERTSINDSKEKFVQEVQEGHGVWRAVVLVRLSVFCHGRSVWGTVAGPAMALFLVASEGAQNRIPLRGVRPLKQHRLRATREMAASGLALTDVATRALVANRTSLLHLQHEGWSLTVRHHGRWPHLSPPQLRSPSPSGAECVHLQRQTQD